MGVLAPWHITDFPQGTCAEQAPQEIFLLLNFLTAFPPASQGWAALSSHITWPKAQSSPTRHEDSPPVLSIWVGRRLTEQTYVTRNFSPFSCIIGCCKINIAAFSKTDNVSAVLRHCWVESRHRWTLCGKGGWWFTVNSPGLVPFSASKAHGQQEQCVTAPTWGRNESWGLGNSVKAASRAGSELWGAQRKGTSPL